MADTDAQMQFEWTSEYPVYSIEGGRVTCLLSLAAGSVSKQNRAPVSISLVLDKSGSMAGTKLQLVKETTLFLLKQLTDRDSLSVIAYDTDVTTVHSLVKATSDNKAAIASAVRGIRAGSTTNLSGGLFQGMQEQLSCTKVPGAEDWALVDTPGKTPPRTVQSVFLFTDGQANAGVCKVDAISHAVRNLLASKDTGEVLKVNTFGFGADHDSDFLEAISGAANGTYYFIAGSEDIPGAFADALGGLLSVVAQNGSLKITPDAACTISAVHTGLSARAQDGGGHVIDVRDLYAEERKDVIVEVELPAIDSAADAFAAATAEITYMDVVAGALVTRSAPLTLRRAAPPLPQATADERVSLHRARLGAAARMREAVALADGGRHADARRLLDDEVAAVASLLAICSCDQTSTLSETALGVPVAAAARAAPAAPAGHSASRAALEGIKGDLERCARQVGNDRQYQRFGKKFVAAQSAMHSCQRSTGVGYGSAAPRRAAQAAAPAAPTLAQALNSSPRVPAGPESTAFLSVLPAAGGAGEDFLGAPPVAPNAPSGAGKKRASGLSGRFRSMFSRSDKGERGSTPAPPLYLSRTRESLREAEPAMYTERTMRQISTYGDTNAASDSDDDEFQADAAAANNPYATRAQIDMVQESRASVLGFTEGADDQLGAPPQST